MPDDKDAAFLSSDIRHPTSEAAQRAAVAELARAWVGLPYYHGQRLRGVGGDCTFFVLVYEDAGLIPATAIPSYSPQAHLHSEAGVYEQIIRRYATPIETPGIGDVVLYKFGRTFSHGGVIVDAGRWVRSPSPLAGEDRGEGSPATSPIIVHGDMVAGRIMLAEGDGGRLADARGRKFFTLWPSG